jgi:hypothetical protein
MVQRERSSSEHSKSVAREVAVLKLVWLSKLSQHLAEYWADRLLKGPLNHTVLDIIKDGVDICAQYTDHCDIDENFNAGINMRTDFSITLRMDVDPEDVETKQVLCDAIRTAAQILHSQAVLVAGKRKPEIGITWENSYEGTNQVELFEPESNLEG